VRGLDALEADSEFLLAGGVFTPDVIDTWIDFKRTNEIAPVQLRPHRGSSTSTTTSQLLLARGLRFQPHG